MLPSTKAGYEARAAAHGRRSAALSYWRDRAAERFGVEHPGRRSMPPRRPRRDGGGFRHESAPGHRMTTAEMAGRTKVVGDPPPPSGPARRYAPRFARRVRRSTERDTESALRVRCRQSTDRAAPSLASAVLFAFLRMLTAMSPLAGMSKHWTRGIGATAAGLGTSRRRQGTAPSLTRRFKAIGIRRPRMSSVSVRRARPSSSASTRPRRSRGRPSRDDFGPRSRPLPPRSRRG